VDDEGCVSKASALHGGGYATKREPCGERPLERRAALPQILRPRTAPGRWIDLPHLEATQPGPVQIDDSEIKVTCTRVAASGTVLVGTGLKSESFFLYGRDASGPTGVTLAGTWTAAEHR
jgi:hypothetical protein